MPGIIWLASYPKSGNTWMRIFLTNYLRNGAAPADINHLDGGPIASAREIFDELVGVEASDLTQDELESLRPQVYEQFTQDLKQDEFLKVHDAYTFNSAGLPLFPPAASRAVINIIRNPLAIAPSLANHINDSVERAIETLNNQKKAGEKRLIGLSGQLPQRWLNWSEHVNSWAQAPGQRVLTIRYEDLKRNTFPAFRAVVRFVGLDDDEERIHKAIEFSAFDQVKKQEQERGFRERIRPTSFFRKGESAAWKSELTLVQIEQILKIHAETMRHYGYLDSAGQPVEALPLEEFNYD
jgi:hypothetical protein